MFNQIIQPGYQSPQGGQVLCQHLSPISKHTLISKLESPVTCKVCAYSGRNQWICLHYGCDFMLCTSEDMAHRVEHTQLSTHPAYLNLTTGEVYCQRCEAHVVESESSTPRASTTKTQMIYPDALGSPNIDVNKCSDKPLGICGLVNLGNTCYMNAALQVLSNCPQVTEYFLRCLDFVNPIHCRLATQYQNFLATTWQTPKSNIISPVPVLREVKSHYPMFSGYGQHDSQEFLRVFLNHLHDELKSQRPSSTQSTGPLGEVPNCHCTATPMSNKPKLNKKNRAKLKQNNGNCSACSVHPVQSLLRNRDPSSASDGHSIITDVFQGKMMSAVRCLSCQQVSCREEPFLDLSVPVGQSGGDVNAKRWVIAPILHRLVPPIIKLDQNRKQSGSSDQTSSSSVNIHSPRLVSSELQSQSPNKPVPEQVPTRALQSLSRLRYSIPLVRRVIVYLLGLIVLSFSWIFTKFTDIQGWFSSPALVLDDCLMDHFSQFELHGENKYYCDRCKRLCNGVNETTISALPEVLCIHLKRFRSHHVDAYKITSNVLFPIEGLEMKPFLHTKCEDKVTTYDLIGVICHMGGCGGGHYVSCARNWRLQTWFEFDDDHVSQVTSQHVENLTSEAYVLFYRKCDTALEPIREEATRLCQEYNLSTFTHYLSHSWFVRLNTWAEPGPIDNALLLCTHGKMKPHNWEDRQSLLITIPETLWMKLQTKFGGGPAIVDLLPCSTCRNELVLRQNQELLGYDRIFEECQPFADTVALCAIDSRWFATWKNFINGLAFKIPETIDNNELVDSRSNFGLFSHSTRTGSILRSPIMNSDAYIVLFESCWEFLVSIYGGGPHIRLRQPRVLPVTFDKFVEPIETELEPDEASLEKLPDTSTPIPVEDQALSSFDHSTQMDCTISNPPIQSPSVNCVEPEPINHHVESYSPSANGDSESGIYGSPNSTHTTFSIRGQGDTNEYAHNRNLSGTSFLSFSTDSLLSNPKGDGTSKDSLNLTNGFRFNGSYSHTNGVHSHSVEHMPSIGDKMASSKSEYPSRTATGESSNSNASIPILKANENFLTCDTKRKGVQTHKRIRLSTAQQFY